MEITSYILAAIAAYLLGSIPTGYLVARARGIDIRSVGSGNIGATNVFRILGKSAGIFVLLVDFLKGFLACWMVARIAGQFFESTPSQKDYLALTSGLAAILGHNYTCWLKFKGGKGIATSAGVLAALFPKVFLIGLALWLLVFLVSRYVSLASIVAAASLPVSAWLTGSSPVMIGVAFFMGALAVYKHKSNIQRLMNGTESRIGKKKEAGQ